MDFSVQLVGIEFAQLLDMAQKVEGLGFRTMYFPDHLVLQGPERQAMGVPAFDPMLQAAIVADATKEVRLADVVNIVGGIGRAGYIALAKASKLSSDTFRDKVRSLRAEAARAGRDGNAIRISAFLFTVHLAESPAAGEAMVESLAGMFGVPPKALQASPLFLVGTPEDCITELRRRQREWEVSEFVVSGMNNLPDLLERFGREVMPHV